MEINIIDLPYHPHAILNLFEKLSKTAWSMLLHSSENINHPDYRFNILVTKPKLTLITKNNQTIITDKNQQITSQINPFVLLNKYMHTENMHQNINNQLPFQGGFIGVFGYDLVRYIEKLPIIAKKDLFLPDMAVGLYRWAIISDYKLCKNYLVTHDNPNPILYWIQKQKYLYFNYKIKKPFYLLKPWKTNINCSEYLKKFNIIKKHLTLGNCYQVCLAQRFFAPYYGNEWSIFRYLLHYNRPSFSAFIRLPNQHSIMSLSPERFLKLNNSRIETQPIKGTISRLPYIHKDQKQKIKLYTSIKNRAENLMIVDLLRNDIGKVAIPGSIYVSKLFNIQSLPKIHHMVSTIIGKLANNFSACDLLHACFPGGSITGAPKIQAMKILEELEPHRRNIWSGSIGYLSCCGNMDINIAIRTLISNGKNLFCSVGSGIVLDSNEQQEYKEMQEKVSTILLPLLNTIKKSL